MIPPSRIFWFRRARAWSLIAVLAFTAVSCSSSNEKSDATTPSTSTASSIAASAVGEGTTPKPSAEVALRELLAAEQKRDHDASYALVLHGEGEEYPSIAQWRRRRTELPAITGVASVEAKGDDVVVATVEHAPGLDPFAGLTPARERQTWKAAKVRGGWLLHGEPDVEFVLPEDAGAVVVAGDWARAVQACDQAAAEKLQGVSVLFGTVTESVQLCNNNRPVSVGEAAPLSPGPLSADIVAQYTTDALEWARIVPILTPVPLQVVLAPIGNEWKIIGVSSES